MKVVMLAAGIGNRLGNVHTLPKCLLEINGITLLSRHISILEKHNITEMLIVTGHEHELIKKEVENISSKLKPDLIFNKDYKKGSVLSFLAAAHQLKIDSPVILMDADVLYHPHIFNTLLTTEYENIFLLDRNFEQGEEPVKLCIKQGKIIEFRKQLPESIRYDVIGESVGFFRFSEHMFRILHKQAKEYRDSSALGEPYEEVIRDVLLKNPALFNYEDITGMPWIEIDFPEDIKKAERLFSQMEVSSNDK